MNEPTLYIVIPCYNCEGTINRCVKSIINAFRRSSSDDYTIILIDDGSTDSTHYAIKKWSENYSRIFAFHRLDNFGPGTTRNLGFEIALEKGAKDNDYIWFIDADDWIEHYSIDTLDPFMMQGIDIICMSRYQNDENVIPFPEGYTIFIEPMDEGKLNYINRVKIIRAAWDKLYRIGICKEEEFSTTMRDEESLFTFMAYLNAKDIVTTSKKLYHYDYTDHGLSANLNITDNLSTWWQIADKIRHSDHLSKKYPKLIPYAFEKNAYDITIGLAERMGINIDKKDIADQVKAMVKYAMEEDQNEKMDSSV